LSTIILRLIPIFCILSLYNNLVEYKALSPLINERECFVKKVLVTGGTGFVGSHLVDNLLAKGVSVRCLVKKDRGSGWLDESKSQIIYGDLENYEILISAVSDVDTVFHLAALTKSATDEGFYKVNVMGTVNLLKAVLQHNPKINRFVFMSSQAASGPSQNNEPVKETDSCHPVNPYGSSKLAAEEVVLAFGSQIPVTIIRPPVVYGPRDVDVFEYYRSIRSGIRPILGSRDRMGSFIYVEDLVGGLILAAEKKEAVGQKYFLVNESIISWRVLDEEIARAMGRRTITLHLSLPIITMVVFVMEIVSKIKGIPSVFNRHKIKELKDRFWICDGSKAIQELGFIPQTSLKDGVRKTLEWYTQEGWL